MWYNVLMKKHPIYEVYFCEDGTAISKNGRTIAPKLGGQEGYERVSIEVWLDAHNRVTKALSRWMAETYLPNPHNCSDVDHIDGNPDNNTLSNLQWLTHQKNAEKTHAKVWIIEDVHFQQSFEVYNLKKWCREHGVNFSALLATSPHCKGKDKRRQSGGYRVLHSIIKDS